MTHSVTLPDQSSFTVYARETVLAAALRQNLNLPHSCQNGFCGQCKAVLLDGQVSLAEHSGRALSAEEAAQGKILMCCATPGSNLRIDIPGYTGAGSIPVRTLPARVQSIAFAHNTALLTLALPKSPQLMFEAGQYVDLLLPGNISRSYSIANAPDGQGLIELHIRRRENGVCADMLFGNAPAIKEKSIVRIKGPLGAPYPYFDCEQPVILLATGTGYAPIRSILLELIRRDFRHPVHFYWGARRAADLYAQAEAAKLIQQLAHGRFMPILSQADDDWQGARGYVQHLAAQDIADMSAYAVYACGAEQMVYAAQALFTGQCGLPPEAFHADAFTPSTAQP
ncbi:2Fe-2S iron-sulfur cluster-binding protein [Bergeriella denitrificans]|uniref:Iron/sulfur-binding oxidoreductase n=1 Tax=Bergeriella denitrificans TaxID=494 RepID=A0A378UJU1_BERDE|nr:2Fe-2S iron-sulfur cluster-binding protein [Bergeriella denitrificans]STZ76751.1 iron/sulfur-binding oxidoreductase [Bergeriella denitrificans]